MRRSAFSPVVQTHNQGSLLVRSRRYNHQVEVEAVDCRTHRYYFICLEFGTSFSDWVVCYTSYSWGYLSLPRRSFHPRSGSVKSCLFCRLPTSSLWFQVMKAPPLVRQLAFGYDVARVYAHPASRVSSPRYKELVPWFDDALHEYTTARLASGFPLRKDL